MKHARHIIPLLFALLTLISCEQQQIKRTAKHIERTLHAQQTTAEQTTQRLSELLSGQSLDSIRELTQANPDILFYIFDKRQMVYWSNNWLAAQEVRVSQYDKWQYKRFDNAHTICRWTYSEGFNILSVIPIEYAYSIQNEQLHNTFISPFKPSKRFGVSQSSDQNGVGIKDKTGDILFYLTHAKAEDKPAANSRLAESFSYQTLLSSSDNKNTHRTSTRTYFIIELLLFVALIVLGIVGLIRSHGWRNMRLRIKFMYVTVTLLLIVSVYIFVVSTMHVRQRYERDQRTMLESKTSYIQKALQDMYFWNINLSENNSVGMNIDLRDLCFAYQTDINVYDLHGQLIGTSAPMLFEQGLISRRISSEQFFGRTASRTQYEQIGDMRYLACYTDFVNGNYDRIGYIAVPLYISSDAVDAEADAFLRKLLPPNLIVLLLALILSFFIARGMTQPLAMLAERMKHLKIGQHGNRIDYNKQDEVGELVARYNEMVDELERSTQLLANSEREGAWRTMARQIAHEINNPLTPMKLTIQQMQRLHNTADDRFDDYFQKSTATLIEQIDHLSHIAASFSQFARMPEVHPEKVDVAARLFSVITLFKQNNQNVAIRYIGPESGIYAIADEKQIAEVFTNLIKNALQAIEGREEGDIIVILKESSDSVQISVSDNGCGISDDVRDKIFQPNFTTKSTGTGLGLAISKNIVDSCGGNISFSSTPQGTTFIVELKNS